MIKTFEREWSKTVKQKEATRLVANHVHTLLAGGSRSGKSALACYLTFVRAAKCKNSRHCITRQTFRDAVNKLGLDTIPTVLKLAFPQLPAKLDKSKWYWTLPNGSEIWLSGLDDTGDRDARILGAEYSTIVYDECDQMAYQSILLARTRLAQKNKLVNRELYTCNPPSMSSWVYRLFVEQTDPEDRKPLQNPDDYAHIIINPKDNLDNIDPNYLRQLEALPKLQRDRFLHGLWGNDSETTLWRREWFYRIEHAPELSRIIVAVDPAGTHNLGSDATGLVVVGKAANNAYVLHSEALKATPEQWGRRVVDLYNYYGANTVVAETNYGGDMVESTIHNVDRAVHVKQVSASRGKAVRAEPISALYEQGHVLHVDEHDKLEDELMQYDILTPPKPSPNIGDALVWAVTELLGNIMPALRASRFDRPVAKDPMTGRRETSKDREQEIRRRHGRRIPADEKNFGGF